MAQRLLLIFEILIFFSHVPPALHPRRDYLEPCLLIGTPRRVCTSMCRGICYFFPPLSLYTILASGHDIEFEMCFTFAPHISKRDAEGSC